MRDDRAMMAKHQDAMVGQQSVTIGQQGLIINKAEHQGAMAR
jgi:hypothetical protein